MNFIAQFINKKGTFTNEISRAQAQAETERLIVLEDISHNVEKNARLKENIRVINARAKQHKSGARKSKIYNLLATMFTIVSFFLSALGITGSKSFTGLFIDARATIICLMLLSISIMLYLTSTQANFLKTYFHFDYARLKMLQITTVTISTIGNYIFLKSILKPTNLFELFVTIVFSVLPDYVTIVFGGISQNVKYANNSYKDETMPKTAIGMLIDIIRKKAIMKLYKPYSNTLKEYTENCKIFLEEKRELIVDNHRDSFKNSLEEKTTPSYENDFVMLDENDTLSYQKTIRIDDLKSSKKNKNNYQNALKKLEEFKQNDVVSKSKLNIRCTDYEWAQLRDRLKKENLITTSGTISRKA